MHYAKSLFMQCYSKAEREALKWKPYWYYYAVYSKADRHKTSPFGTDLKDPISNITPRKWIVDSGSCFDLVNKDELSIADRGNLKATSPIHMQTANATVTAHHEL